MKRILCGLTPSIVAMTCVFSWPALAGHDSASQIRASRLIGMEVRNEQNESLGKVDDLVVNVDSGATPYAIISHGGTFGVGRTRTAVPLDSLHCRDDHKTLTLAATREELNAAEKVPAGAWVGASDAAWARSVDGFYGRPRVRPETDVYTNSTDRVERDGRLTPPDPVPKGAEVLMRSADVQLCERVCNSIEAVQVQVNNGVVTLRGTVDSEQARENIGTKVRSIEGVQRVDNRLQVR